MRNELLVKSYNAEEAIGAYLIVKFGVNGGGVLKASNDQSAAIGVTNELATAEGDRVDVIREGITPVYYGGTVAKGDPLTAKSDGSGKAVKATAAPGAVTRIIGFAEEAGVTGDLGSMRLNPGFLANASAVVALTISGIDLVAANAKKYRVVTPISGTVTKIYSCIDGALATGDATLTGKINGNAITDGAITITQAGSAAADVDSATPSAANAVEIGDYIEIDVGGANTAAKTAIVTIVVAS